jgi:hypothetical protein
MIEFVTDKTKIATAVVDLIKDKTAITVDIASRIFWKNIRNTGGLGLTSYGYEAFKIAELEFWEFPFSTVTKYGTLSIISYSVIVDRKLPCPWYMNVTKKEKCIAVFDSRVATMITLHGDFGHYLDTLENIYDE